MSGINEEHLRRLSPSEAIRYFNRIEIKERMKEERKYKFWNKVLEAFGGKGN